MHQSQVFNSANMSFTAIHEIRILANISEFTVFGCSCFIDFIKRLGGKEIKCQACRVLYLFCNKFNKFNNTGARMLDSIYHMTLKILKNCIFGEKTRFLLFYATLNGRHNVSKKSVNLLWFVHFFAWRYITPRRDIM